MSAKHSAGLIVFRVRPDGSPEVLIGHMGGPLWSKRDRAWTIPKGEYDADEDPHAAAEREFAEELGFPAPPGDDLAGDDIDLGSITQKAGKGVTAWARRADPDLSGFASNTFELQWPPRSGRTQVFPELDRVDWFGLDEARELVVAGQVELLDRLAEALSS